MPKPPRSPIRGYALVADLAASRSQAGRAALSKEIESALKTIGRRKGWLAPPVTVKGLDEISSVLAEPDGAFDVAVDLNAALWPRRFRFGFAYGEIDVGGRGGDAGAMDGASFHAAADALARAQRHDLPFAVTLPGMAESERLLIESTARLHGVLMRGRSKGAAAVAKLARLRPDETQAEIAARSHRSPQAVSAALLRAHAAELAEAEFAIRSALAAYGAARRRP